MTGDILPLQDRCGLVLPDLGGTDHYFTDVSMVSWDYATFTRFRFFAQCITFPTKDERQRVFAVHQQNHQRIACPRFSPAFSAHLLKNFDRLVDLHAVVGISLSRKMHRDRPERSGKPSGEPLHMDTKPTTSSQLMQTGGARSMWRICLIRCLEASDTATLPPTIAAFTTPSILIASSHYLPFQLAAQPCSIEHAALDFSSSIERPDPASHCTPTRSYHWAGRAAGVRTQAEQPGKPSSHHGDRQTTFISLPLCASQMVPHVVVS